MWTRGRWAREQPVTKSDALVVVPTFNEAENIADALERIHQAEPSVHVLVVDDGSPDGTADIVRSLAKSDDRISLLERSGPRGLGPAYLAGFARGMEEGYELLIEMDADGSHPASALPALIRAVRNSDEIGGSIGSRWVEGGAVVNWPRSREIISRCGSAYARAVLGLNVKDVTAGYRVYRSSALRSIDLGKVQSQGYCFQIDLTRRMIDAGHRLVEVPITFTDRVHGVSKMSKTIVLEAMWRVSVWGFARLFRWDSTRDRDSRN
jgi:glycosyltransferase involved in cell wall biosynthesis